MDSATRASKTLFLEARFPFPCNRGVEAARSAARDPFSLPSLLFCLDMFCIVQYGIEKYDMVWYAGLLRGRGHAKHGPKTTLAEDKLNGSRAALRAASTL